MGEEIVVQGRRTSGSEVERLKGWIQDNADWSRKRIARELCRRWQWVDGRGRLKDFAARSFLLKLEALGRIELPALQVHQRRVQRPAPEWPGWEEPQAWSGALAEISPVSVKRVEAGSPEGKRWRFYLDRYHYLGLRVVGENLGYLATDRLGRDVGCLLFGAAAWKCAARDVKLGWNGQSKQRALWRVANNSRFLVLPWVLVPQLASHVLGAAARGINQDWQSKYGHGVDWLETFVDRERFGGICYRAANWQWVGQTRGRSRQDRQHRLKVPVKDVYLYDLKGRRER